MNYSKIGMIEAKRNPAGACIICNKRGANLQISIQHDKLRNNDTIVYVHRECFCDKTADAFLKIVGCRDKNNI